MSIYYQIYSNIAYDSHTITCSVTSSHETCHRLHVHRSLRDYSSGQVISLPLGTVLRMPYHTVTHTGWTGTRQFLAVLPHIIMKSYQLWHCSRAARTPALGTTYMSGTCTQTQSTVRRRNRTGICETSRRVPIFSLLPREASKRVFRQRNWVQDQEAQIRFPAGGLEFDSIE